ncbi:hypothetical protein HanIR_Chr08g0358251 [Helianthus annuus]|nr:hypothetical protein HanIR_Chr08g0358251 [Helianthus annuus]
MAGICRSSIPPLKRRSPIFFTCICRDLQFHLRNPKPTHHPPLHHPSRAPPNPATEHLSTLL